VLWFRVSVAVTNLPINSLSFNYGSFTDTLTKVVMVEWTEQHLVLAPVATVPSDTQKPILAAMLRFHKNFRNYTNRLTQKGS